MTKHLSNNIMAAIALLLVSVSLMINYSIISHTQVTGSATATGIVSICINNPPTVNTGSCETSTAIDLSYTCTVNATDADNNGLTLSDNTSLFEINLSTGLINFTPTSSDVGNKSILITASDNSTCTNNNGTATLNLEITGAVCGNGVCEIGETCSSCQADCGSCPVEEVPAAEGGGAAPIVVMPEYEIDKKQLKAILKVGETTTKDLTLTNTGETRINFETNIDALQEYVSLSETDFSLGVGESKTVTVSFDSDDLNPDVYTGELKIDGSYDDKVVSRRVTLVMEVEKGLLDMDLRINIPEEYQLLEPGDNLYARFSLLGLGDFEDINTALYYFIKDSSDTVIYSEVAPTKLGDAFYGRKIVLPPGLGYGSYVLYVKAVHGESTAVSSEIFEIIDKKAVEAPEALPRELIASAVLEKVQREYLIPTILGVAIILLIILNILYVHHRDIKKSHQLHKKRIKTGQKRSQRYEKSALKHSISNVEKHLNLLKIGHELGHIRKSSYETGREKLLRKHKRLKSKLKR